MFRQFDWMRFTVPAALAVLLPLSVLLAVHDDDLFELGDAGGAPGSADIVGSDLQAGCDWADLFDADPTAEEIAAAVEACGGADAVFIEDQVASSGGKDDTAFVKGTSKNDNPIAEWRWDSSKVPGKNDLENLYTFATNDEAGDLVLYAGVERLVARGDSHVDFEFNQAAIGLDKDPPCGEDGSDGAGDGAPCEFVGERLEGDLLLVVDFEKGGDLGFVEIRRWNGTTFELIESLGGEGCNAADTVCALNNGGPIDGGPWNGGETLEKNAFTEIGVNVTQLFGSPPCFFTVQAKTRSSSSFNSSLQDFARASFEICSLEVVKGGSPDNPDPSRTKQGDDYIFRYTITNTGAVPLFCSEIQDSFLGDITEEGCGIPGADANGDCQQLLPKQFCEFDVMSMIPEDAPDPFDTSVEASFTTDPVLAPVDVVSDVTTDEAIDQTTVSDVSGTDSFPLELFQPSVDVEKTADASVTTAGNLVTFTITVTDTSSEDSPDLANGVINDAMLGGDLLDPANPFVVSSDCESALPLGATCTIVAERETLDSDVDPLVNTVDVLYNPAGGFPNEITDESTVTIQVVSPSFTLSVSANPTEAAPGDTVVFTYTIVNTGDVALDKIEVVDSLNGDISDRFPDTIGVGETVTVEISYVIQSDDPNPLVVETTATYEAISVQRQVTVVEVVTIDIITPCALSPGFWGGGEGVPKWDEPTDPIAQKAGFTTDTVFPWLDPSLAGSTYLEVLKLPALGDVTKQLSFKYIAARLNQAAFGVSASTAALLDSIDVYFASNPVGSDPQGAAKNEGEALLADINGYFATVGESECPPTSEF